jgi:hypothetical protein
MRWSLASNISCGQRAAPGAVKRVRILKRYGRKRLVMVHEQADLADQPRFLLTDALHWEGGRVIRVWSDLWPVEIFHEFCKQAVGAGSVSGTQGGSGQTPLSLELRSAVAASARPGGGKKSVRLSFAENDQPTVGQKLHTLTRDALGPLLHWVQGLFAQGQSQEQVLERLMPA